MYILVCLSIWPGLWSPCEQPSDSILSCVCMIYSLITSVFCQARTFLTMAGSMKIPISRSFLQKRLLMYSVCELSFSTSPIPSLSIAPTTHRGATQHQADEMPGKRGSDITNNLWRPITQPKHRETSLVMRLGTKEGQITPSFLPSGRQHPGTAFSASLPQTPSLLEHDCYLLCLFTAPSQIRQQEKGGNVVPPHCLLSSCLTSLSFSLLLHWMCTFQTWHQHLTLAPGST